MELRRKLTILADAAKYDASCASSGSTRKTPEGGLGNTEGMGICHSYTPDGRCVSLLKILLTNHCVFDCLYCVNRISSDVERARFTPAEVVDLTLEFYKRNYIEGLFLSSGVAKSPDHTMEQMVTVASTLRREHRFGGYIHLKAVAGASAELIRRAGTFADRVSVNIELPSADDLSRLAAEKSMPSIESSMESLSRGIEESRRDRRAPRFAPAGQSTQMIVGATASSDSRILATASHLYAAHRLRRVYYSAFSPIPHADFRLPSKSPPLVREHRLYQADWLIRYYGFRHEELTEGADDNLDLDIDPKLAWALRHRDAFPVDVNQAPREALLRIPGLGVRSVDRIVAMRRHRALRLEDLVRMRLPLAKIASFIVAAGPESLRAPRSIDAVALTKQLRPPKQLGLFDALVTARSGEL